MIGLNILLMAWMLGCFYQCLHLISSTEGLPNCLQLEMVHIDLIKYLFEQGI